MQKMVYKSCFWQVEVFKWQKCKYKYLNGKNYQVQGVADVLGLDYIDDKLYFYHINH